MKRRNFVGVTACLPLVQSISASANPTRAKPQSCEVAVIGAGLAGLNTALILQAQGKDVQLIEALDRVGGRKQTTEAGGLRFELGAAEIGDNYPRFLASAKQLGVSLVAPKSVPTGLAFAGRHTVFDYSGMEAALASGERAAEMILR